MTKLLRNEYLEKSKFLLIVLFFFFIFSFISFTSATATWNGKLDEFAIETNDFGWVDLTEYCTNCDYFWITFANPDNRIQIVSFKSSENPKHSNSYFDLALSPNGTLWVKTKFKELDFHTDVQLNVYISDIPQKPQAVDYTYLRIRDSLYPKQVDDFTNPIQLEGNNSWNINLFKHFDLTFPRIYNLEVESVFAYASTTYTLTTDDTAQQCLPASFPVTACVTPTGILSIKGENATSNVTLLISAVNEWGRTAVNPIVIHNFPTITENYSAIPTRSFINIPNLTMGYNQTEWIPLDKIWSNLLWVDAIVPYSNGTNRTISSSFNGTFSSLFIENNKTAEVTWNAFVARSNFTQGNYTIWFRGCNNGGCDSTNAFTYLNIIGFPPIITKGSVDDPIPVPLDFRQYKAVDLNNYYDNLTYAIINFTDPTYYDNVSIKTPVTANYNSSNTQVRNYTSPLGFPYEIGITKGNVIYMTSLTTELYIPVSVVVCNTGACIEGIPIGFYVVNSTIPEAISQEQVNSVIFTNVGNTFLGIFPDKDNLNATQKIGIIVLTIFIINLIILFALNKAGVSGVVLGYLMVILSSLIFLFFIIKGYVSVVVPIVLAFIGLVLAYFKLKGGGGE